MTTTLIALVLIGLLALALERNHRRQPPGPRSPLAGSSDIPDRDTQRVRAELAYPAEDIRSTSSTSTATAQEPKSRKAPTPAPLRRPGAAGLTR
ncbi:hypothetical protein ABH925_006698 [Streptacidiphilus sp. EB129]